MAFAMEQAEVERQCAEDEGEEACPMPDGDVQDGSHVEVATRSL
jgi:hypothetical protein